VHSLVRRYLKTAIAFLGVGLMLGGWSLVLRELRGSYPSPYLISAHTHALLVGFVMMMILGVALWLFPRPEKADVRYDPRTASVAYWLVTLGTAGRIAGELLRMGSSGAPLRWGIVLAGFAQIVGIGVYFYTMWSRIRPVGSKVREANGERF
jgi:heme/copper-type cytochrome/quinol oxidase subunit 1